MVAAFQKAKAEQAAIKAAMFGPPGSGKTLTALLVAEGLAKAAGKRVAFVDTERGTDFYVKPVPARKCHPEAFDIDCLYTRSLTDTLSAVQALDHNVYAAVVIDSMTHIWEATVNAYRGRRLSNGKIPMQAWDSIKRPYKTLMQCLLNSPLHVFILGRQSNAWGTDEENGETINTGFKMRAEGETAYEPHLLIRMEAIRPRTADNKRALNRQVAVPTAFIEKDRSGVLGGKLIEWPNFESLALPILGLLGDTQARLQDDDETSRHDADTLQQQERAKAKASRERLEEFAAQMRLAKSKDDLHAVGSRITDDIKGQMLEQDVIALRSNYDAALQRVSANGNHK